MGEPPGVVKIRPLEIAGAFEITPDQYADERGAFLEWYRLDHLTEALGREPQWVQANLSSSRAGVVRGIHVTAVPPGQAKYVTCVSGAVFDVIVDLRVGSPTFGRWVGTRLDDVDRKAVYFAEGLGHAFCAITDGATVTYLCSQRFDPAREHAVNPLDPELAIAWPVESPSLSAKDANAPSLAEVLASGVLPSYADCPS